MPTSFTDGNRTISLALHEIDTRDGQLLPDWSNDFYDTGCLEQDNDGSYIVHDVNYLVEQALDWKYSTGDYRGDLPADPGFRCVWVDSVYLTRNNPAASNRSVDPITHMQVPKYENEMASARSSLDFIRRMCDNLSRVCSQISDRADPRIVSEILSEIRRAENALSLANNARWRC